MEYWNDGKVEYWLSKAHDGLILLSDPGHPYKADFIPQTHYSIIPVFHHPLAYVCGTTNLI